VATAQNSKSVNTATMMPSKSWFEKKAGEMPTAVTATMCTTLRANTTDNHFALAMRSLMNNVAPITNSSNKTAGTFMSIASKRKDHDKWAQNNYLPNNMSIELEDHSWFPAWLRRYQMEYISFLAEKLGLYAPVLPTLKTLQDQHRFDTWTDCCSGSAGPVQYLLQHDFTTATIILTDKYVQPIPFAKTNTAIHLKEMNVLQDAIPGHGLVTMFNALHHFSHTERKQIIQTIAQEKRPFLFAEITHPNVINLLSISFATIIGQLLFAPFISPFSFQRLLFTYLLPINLITITWDGWMSVFRSISCNSFLQLKNDTSTDSYSVSFIQKGPWWKKVSILTGQPTT
jgi:hypothetical protein